MSPLLQHYHEKIQKDLCAGQKTAQAGNPAFFSDRRPLSPTKKSRVSFFVLCTAKRHKKVRECSVSIIFVCLVCFVVKKADGLRTPCGKYTVGDSFLEIILCQQVGNHTEPFPV